MALYWRDVSGMRWAGAVSTFWVGFTPLTYGVVNTTPLKLNLGDGVPKRYPIAHSI